MKLYMQGVDIFKQGNHRDLMKKAELYAKLYNSQF
ncbi:MAG: ABC transporter ATP-binding protein [Eggerthellaceae bacterium]|nr:ABC transporter ATP-binding protein [Eggerthellaceae bacterium]